MTTDVIGEAVTSFGNTEATHPFGRLNDHHRRASAGECEGGSETAWSRAENDGIRPVHARSFSPVTPRRPVTSGPRFAGAAWDMLATMLCEEWRS